MYLAAGLSLFAGLAPTPPLQSLYPCGFAVSCLCEYAKFYAILPLIHADFGSRSFSLALVLRVCGPAAVGLCGSGSCCPRQSYRRWICVPPCPYMRIIRPFLICKGVARFPFFYPCRSMARPFLIVMLYVRSFFHRVAMRCGDFF